jgi:Ca-activated chloride channel family protein
MESDPNNFVSRAFLFTDGLPTVGVRERQPLIEMARERPEGVSLTTYGFGVEVDAELLGSMARAGGGSYYYVKNLDECASFFGLELGGLISCMAQGVKVKVSAAAGVKLLKVLNDVDVEANDDQTECAISMDDVYAEETRPILMEMELPEKSKAVAARPSKLCDVEVSFVDMKTNKKGKLEETVKIEYVDEVDAQKVSDELVAEQIARFKAREAQLQAKAYADKGQWVAAQGVVRGAAMQLKSIGTVSASAMAADLEGDVMKGLSASTYDANYLATNASSYGGARGMTAGASKLFASKSREATAVSFQQQAQSMVPKASKGGVGSVPKSPQPVQPPPAQGLAKRRNRGI